MSIKRNLVLIAIGGVAFVSASAFSVVVNSLVRSMTGVSEPDPPAQMKETPEAKARAEEDRKKVKQGLDTVLGLF
jgi:hypothetical protein